jgi:hypothetical protein
MPNLQTQGASKPNPPELIRQLGFFSATALVISNMVGMVIFTAKLAKSTPDGPYIGP